ncbi:acyltransferase family protein [Rhodoblastus sp.]|uniref:acyltransferase family protein n=1 Tax=Rhodoblastus sp. TaxID=1962975 RepID=UPI0035B05819
MDKPVSEKGFDAAMSKPFAHHDFRPDINGLRALAVLAVVAFHAGLPVWGGFVGVDIFFVISGFLITRIILSERVAGAFSIAGFYGKRVRRILPALLLVMFVSWGVGWFMLNPDDFRRFGGHMEGSSYFSVNLWLYRQAQGPAAYFDPAARYMPLLHLWSLSIEEQFYLIWPALMLLLFRVSRFLLPAIAALFLLSLAFSIFITPRDPNAAFFFLSSRAWELALGALLAQRAVFADPPPSSAFALNLRAGLGIAMMLASLWLYSEATPWPGSAALLPTVGCALVIGAPGAQISNILLGNRIAQFFGRISYPLYLWHWPLLSFAHVNVGELLPPWLMALLLGFSVLFAWLTWRFIERPVAKGYSRRPLVVAGILLATTALAGGLGSLTRQQNGFPKRSPPEVLAIVDYVGVAAKVLVANHVCSDSEIARMGSLDEQKSKAHAFYERSGCLKIDNPERPIVALLGDSHAMHLIPGLREVYGDRINLVIMGAGGCAPLIPKTDWSTGLAGSLRCRANNAAIFENLAALKPTAIIASAFFQDFHDSVIRSYPTFLQDFDTNVASLRKAGVASPIIVMGEVPTWSPALPSLLEREIYAGKKPSDFTFDSLDRRSLDVDAIFAAHRWGDNVVYISQARALCGPEGCRRIVGPHLPEDMISMDYGHYTPAGSIYAVKNILAPVLDPILAAARKPE